MNRLAAETAGKDKELATKSTKFKKGHGKKSEKKMGCG
jgi:hypothetical protein